MKFVFTIIEKYIAQKIINLDIDNKIINKMSHLFNKAPIKDLIESFQEYTAKQIIIQEYPEELLESRMQIITWLNFLCENLSFRKETLYRAISIYDIYISKTNQNFSLYQIKLIAIASLSLATKIEEINCNFVNFLTSKVLNGQEEQLYTKKDLTMKELEICQKLNFNLMQTTLYQFMTIFQQICFNVLGKGDIFDFFLAISESLLFNFAQSNNAILLSTKDGATYVFNQTLCQFNVYYFQSNPQSTGIISFNITNLIQKIFVKNKDRFMTQKIQNEPFPIRSQSNLKKVKAF